MVEGREKLLSMSGVVTSSDNILLLLSVIISALLKSSVSAAGTRARLFDC